MPLLENATEASTKKSGSLKFDDEIESELKEFDR